MAPGGAEAAERLGLPDDAVKRALVSAPAEVGAAAWVERVARAPGLPAKLRLLAWLVAPSRAYMEMLHPSARRGRARLALAYALRPFALVARAPVVLVTWRRAHREAHG
jgi:hypothetical protein